MWTRGDDKIANFNIFENLTLFRLFYFLGRRFGLFGWESRELVPSTRVTEDLGLAIKCRKQERIMAVKPTFETNKTLVHF